MMPGFALHGWNRRKLPRILFAVWHAGTLTQNVMGFVAASIGGVMYGAGASDAEPVSSREPSKAASLKLPALSEIQPSQLQPPLQQPASSAREAAAAAAAAGPHTLAGCVPLRALLAENMRAALPRGPLTAAARQARELFWALAMCNTVVPQPSDDGASIKYQASSLALPCCQLPSLTV